MSTYQRWCYLDDIEDRSVRGVWKVGGVMWGRNGTPLGGMLGKGTILTKLRHMEQYLHWDSNHFISAKNSIFNTLAYRARVLCSNQIILQQENDHIRKALLACNSPRPSTDYLSNLTTGITLTVHTVNNGQNNNTNNTRSNNRSISIVVPHKKDSVKG